MSTTSPLNKCRVVTLCSKVSLKERSLSFQSSLRFPFEWAKWAPFYSAIHYNSVITFWGPFPDRIEVDSVLWFHFFFAAFTFSETWLMTTNTIRSSGQMAPDPKTTRGITLIGEPHLTVLWWPPLKSTITGNSWDKPARKIAQEVSVEKHHLNKSGFSTTWQSKSVVWQ